MKQSIEEIEVAGKRVLIRVDFNVPMSQGVITDDRRLRMTLPTIKSVLSRGGKVTLLSHLGRPAGEGFKEQFSLSPVAIRLSELLEQPVSFSDEDTSSLIILRENLRFNAGEKTGDEEFARALAEGADIYCNDAFGTAHRNHASLVAVPQVMEGKPRVAGLLLSQELHYLNHVIAHGEHPFVAILGGAKVSDKMGAIEQLLGKVDTILIGGALAYTFLIASGEKVGSSLVESNRIDEARHVLDLVVTSQTSIVLPSDHICVQTIESGAPFQIENGSIPDGWMGVDIGPETMAKFSHFLSEAKTIVWNGPMGVFEIEPFEIGTKGVAFAIAKATANSAISIVGGGDTAAAISAFELEGKMTHISTGGGASLQMLEGKTFSSVNLLDDAV